MENEKEKIIIKIELKFKIDEKEYKLKIETNKKIKYFLPLKLNYFRK